MPAKPPEDPGSGGGESKGGSKPCPECGKPANEASKPFCSERCRDVDLNRWLSGSYVVPGRPEADEEAD